MAKDASFLADLLNGYRELWGSGVRFTRRNVLRVTGATIVDNPNYVDPDTGLTVGSTDVTITDSGAGITPFLVGTLRTTPPSGTRAAQVVDGYYSQADGGQGLFVWNSTDTRSDNSGTIIQVTGTATGRWNRVFSGPVDVRWFGAKGDGSTNDEPAIALADACAAGLTGAGCELIFSPGNYVLSSNFSTTAHVRYRFLAGAQLRPGSSALSGTVSLTNGSTAATFSTSQTLGHGTPLQISSQPGITFYLASDMSGTSGTFSLPFLGKTQSGLSVTSPITVTINSTIEADPAAQIFGGTGIITFGLGSQQFVSADWWGTSHLQAAVSAASIAYVSGTGIVFLGIEVRLRNVTYNLGSGFFGLYVTQNARIVGPVESDTNPTYVDGYSGGPVLSYTGMGDGVVVGDPTSGHLVANNIVLANARVQVTNAAVCAMRVTQVAYSRFSRLRLVGHGGTLQTNIQNLGNTVHVANGSASITFSTPVTLSAGSGLVFQQQPGVTYYLASPISSSTSGTLTVNYNGTTNTATVAVDPATQYNRVGLIYNNTVEVLFDQLAVDGSAPGTGQPNTWGFGIASSFGISSTTTVFRDCFIQHCQVGQYIASAWSNFDNVVFEDCLRACDIAVRSQVVYENCWWEDNGGSGGTGGNTMPANGYVGESVCRITSINSDGGPCQVTIINPFVNCYQGQNYLFQIGGNSESILTVEQGQVRFSNDYVDIVSSTNASPIVVTTAQPLYLGNDGLSHSPFYVSVITSPGNSGALGIWQITAVDDNNFALFNQQAVVQGAYYAEALGSTGTGVGTASAASVGAVPFFFLGQTELTSMNVKVRRLQVFTAGPGVQIYPVTGGLIGQAGDSFSWRCLDFDLRHESVRFVTTSVAANATATLTLDSNFAGNYYPVPEDGYILGIAATYSNAIGASSGTMDIKVYRHISGSDYLMLDTSTYGGAGVAANAVQTFDKAPLTTPVKKGDLLKVTATTTTGFATTGGNLLVEVLVGRGKALQ